MKNSYLLIALVLIVLVNGIILLGVVGNRSGAVEATLTLTERELDYPGAYQKEENSGVSLRFDWNEYSSGQSWFDAQKLTDLGFDIEVIKQNNQDWNYYRRLLPKRGYVVLEYAGEAWRNYQVEKETEIAELEGKTPADAEEAEQLASQVARIRHNLLSCSRLFAVDVGPGPDALRQRYPDRSRFAIVAAEVRAGYSYTDERKVHGRIVQLLVDRLHVPLPLQKPLVGLPPRKHPSSYDASPEARNWQPRYTVTVNWGNRFEPWVEAVVLTPAGEKE